MHSEKSLPRNGKEILLFLFIVSIISVNIIGPLITGFQFGFNKEIYFRTLRILPLIWVIIVFLVTMVARPLVEKLMKKFTSPTDGFNARILFTILFNVTILSFLMTIIGALIGKGELSLEPFQNLFYNWPRNFFIAFWVEALIAQPVARFVMRKIHERQLFKVETEEL